MAERLSPAKMIVLDANILIRDDRPKSKEEAKRSEFKECKYTTDAIITEGSDRGTIHKVCSNPSCPVHHLKQKVSRNDEHWKPSKIAMV